MIFIVGTKRPVRTDDELTTLVLNTLGQSDTKSPLAVITVKCRGRKDYLRKVKEALACQPARHFYYIRDDEARTISDETRAHLKGFIEAVENGKVRL